MPSADLLHLVQDNVMLSKQRWVSGKHYARMRGDGLKKMNASKKEISRHLEETYWKKDAAMWFD